MIREMLNVETKNGRSGLLPAEDYSKISKFTINDLLDTTIEVTRHLNIDGRGRCNFHGDFEGLSFLRRIGERSNQLLDSNSLKRNMSGLIPLPQAEGSARSLLYPIQVESTTPCMLPSEAAAVRLIRTALRGHLLHDEFYSSAFL
jgi:hypothetical protein